MKGKYHITIAIHKVNSKVQDMNLSLQGNQTVGFVNELVATSTRECLHDLVSDFFCNKDSVKVNKHMLVALQQKKNRQVNVPST